MPAKAARLIPRAINSPENANCTCAMRRGTFIFIFLGIAWPIGSDAQEIALPAYKTVRYEEDYSYLKDEMRQTERLDALKFISLNQERSAYVTFGGETRERYEYFHNSL